MYRIIVRKKVARSFVRLPLNARSAFKHLLDDLRDKGPEYSNFSRLGPSIYHCHLARKWVACWICAGHSMEIEVYYVGSRENAPY
jgi:hypothetical protein